jgi:thiamine biosynthesis lipoprotein
MKRRRFLTIAAAAALTGSAGRTQPPKRLTWQGTAMGADIAITLEGPEALTRPALARARLEIAAVERRFNLYDPMSEISALNRHGILADPDMAWRDLLAICDRMHHLTRGVFDPTIQPLWRALANGGDITAARARLGWGRLRLPFAGQRRLHLDAGQQISLNGIAQGYASDAVARALRQSGLTKVLVDMGEARALGGPWFLRAADLGQITLRDQALAVSVPDALRVGGRSHILHPSQDSAPKWTSAAVVADTAAVADALSTAACHMSVAALQGALTRSPDIITIILRDATGAIIHLRRPDGQIGS